MRILRQYVLREFLAPVFYCFLAFASLYLIIELFSVFDKILPAKPPISMVLNYLGGHIAKDFQWLITPSLLLGGLYTMWQLARHGEITAMRANGISFSTITSPMLAASVFFAALIAINSEFYAPNATRSTTWIKLSGFKGYGPSEYSEVPYNNAKDHREWQMNKFYPNDGSADNVKITWTNNDGKPYQILEAKKGRYVDRTWWFNDAVLKTFRVSDDSNAQILVNLDKRDLLIMPDLTETPRDFLLETAQSSIVVDSVNFSVRDMIRFIKSRPKLAPATRISWEYEIASRFATPFACIVITLFAIPAGVATGRQSVFIGVVTAIVMFLLFYVLTISSGVMAKKGVLPIPVGILIPNVVFLSAGIYLFWRQR